MSRFPAYRPRRLRRSEALRRLVRETRVVTEQLVQPLFVVPGDGVERAVESMPGVAQRSVDRTAEECRRLADVGVPAVLLFGIPEEKDARGRAATDPGGIIPRALHAVRRATPGLVLITDVCLCEYTDHGHCGVVREGDFDNDATLELLAAEALAHARAGADLVAPSDMMDGRVGAIRGALDAAGFAPLPIMSYAAKFASALYGPVRDAAESTPALGDRRSYQLGPAAVVALAAPAPALDESELGRRFLLTARGELPIVQDPSVTTYVERVGEKLVRVLGPQSFDYRFFVVQHPALNAFAVPGGYVFVFSGLLARVDNDDELAGVLAHEIGHVSGHHLLRQQKEGQVWTAAALLGLLVSAINPVLGAAGIAPAETAQLKYSREFEQEADYLGLRYSSEAGYDPHALGSFFKELLADQRINSAGVPAYMLTHPLTEDRGANVATAIKIGRASWRGRG